MYTHDCGQSQGPVDILANGHSKPSMATTYRLIPLDETVVFPHMQVTLPVDVGTESRVFLVPRHDTDYARVGVVADVVERIQLPGQARAVSLQALHRGVAGAA